MSAKVWTQDAARWLLIPLSLGFITAAAAIDADANSDREIVALELRGAVADSPRPAAVSKPVVIALAIPTAPTRSIENAVPPQANIAPLMSPLPEPAPARFFTISEVMASRAGQAQRDNSVHMASADPTASATIDIPTGSKGDGPFGLFTFAAPDGQLWTKWRKVADEIRAEEPTLTRCLTDSKQCSSAVARFSAIVNDAREKNGRARFDLVNERVNTAIHYKSDMEQWGVADLWSPPINTNDTGSFSTGFGDCEDFAIAKYVALRAAGVPARQLRVLLVHDNVARMDHAVLAAQDDGHWYILDNRWSATVEDTDVRQFSPLFALDDQGVKLLAVPYAPKIQSMSEVTAPRKQIFVPGGELAEQSQVPLKRDIPGTGLRGSIL